MKAKKRKKLAIALIANDLLNSRLVYGLEALGLEAGAYGLYLTVPVLKLMGFLGEQRTEEVFELYVEMVKFASTSESGETSYNAMRELAKEIYREIIDKTAPIPIETAPDPDSTDPS